MVRRDYAKKKQKTISTESRKNTFECGHSASKRWDGNKNEKFHATQQFFCNTLPNVGDPRARE